MLGLLFAGEGLVPSAKVPLRTQQALGPLKARAVTTEMSALRTAAIVGVSALSAMRFALGNRIRSPIPSLRRCRW